MSNTELYINGALCDTAANFNVRLNRQLIKPGELNTKDAQYSYSVTLPPTSNNHAIFNYANIEETKDKFNREYKAELIINSVRVFKGLFRLSEISRNYYKGNLYVPAAKGIKDIFGELKLSENPPYLLTFADFVTWVNKYNTDAQKEPQKAIFPYTLYGVLPKVPLNKEGEFSDKTVWDDSVRIGIQDLPPSLNVIKLIEHLFAGQGYKLQGTALNDDRLKNLYMSYKNEPDHVQPWNYGELGVMHIGGVWSSSYNKRTGAADRQLEKGVYQGNNEKYKAYGCDLLNATNSKITVKTDRGSNILYKEVTDDVGTWTQCQVRIPASGFYKVHLSAGIRLYDNTGRRWQATDKDTGIQHICCITDDATNSFMNKMYEVRLIRDRGKGDFNLTNPKLNGTFYYDNLPQNDRLEGDAGFDPAADLPKFYPPVSVERGQQLFIDAAQDPYMLCGFGFGLVKSGQHRNPQDVFTPSPSLAQVQIAKPAQSWDASAEYTTRLAVPNAFPGKDGKLYGYKKYGFIGDTGVIGYQDSDRFKIEVKGVPPESNNRAFRGKYWGDEEVNIFYNGWGNANAIVWLEAGEILTVASVSEEGVYKDGKTLYGWTEHEITFDLRILPFRTDPDWLKVDLTGKSTAPMNWNDPDNFNRDRIDLIGFLPSDMKTDDFIDNFCKAFNLCLSQIDAKTFSLDVKQSKTNTSNLYINLDGFASVRDRVNMPLSLPSLYKVGFTVDKEEEGYKLSGDDGGGQFETGATGEKVLEQKSNFSYNWFKNITKKEAGGDVILPLAVISKHEVWDGAMSYSEAMRKRYTSQALRFWYYDGLLNDLGATFKLGSFDQPVKIAKVSNVLPGRNVLNYKDEKLTILYNYFTLLINGSSHYTEVEGYLTPSQYEALNGSVTAMFNGDLYYVAELSGYDPLGKNKTKIKLIRMI